MSYPQGTQHHLPVQDAPKPRKFGALAWTSLILGIVGLVGSPIILLNNLTAVIAGVGVVLGLIALFGSRKILAGIGVVLCVLAVVATVVAQNAAVKALDEAFNGTTNEGTVSGGDAKADAVKSPPTWDQRYTWENGLAAEVSAPAACTPGEFAIPSDVARGVKVTVTVVNGSDKPFDTGLLSAGGETQFAGKKAEKIYDSSGACGDSALATATVLPGKTFTYDLAFAVGAEPGELQITLQPDFGADKAIFVGQA
ncbi:hypothetical protein AB0I60_17915 [Actinosynnema sp. NPDC050436]|uniref:hypothetical protein n=1 Tax=Actinosynnema sp. NPDC050436 TaxID=3155659 RepID=UPI0033CD0231